MLSTQQTMQRFFIVFAISLVKLKPSIYPGIPPLRFLTNGLAYGSRAVLFIYKLLFIDGFNAKVLVFTKQYLYLHLKIYCSFFIKYIR